MKGGVKMETALLDSAIKNGLFAIMFVFLFIYMLKENKEREQKYISTIDKLSDKIGIVEEIREDIIEIKSDIEQIKIKQ